jgi:hypothetical protein
MTNSIFSERDSNLELMGFDSYEEYLNSDLWIWIRSRLLLSIADKCECCLTTSGLCLHHRDYSLPVLCGNFSNVHRNVVRVCSECHRAIHTDGKEWFSLDVADERFQVLAGRAVLSHRGGFNRDDLPTELPRISEFETGGY